MLNKGNHLKLNSIKIQPTDPTRHSKMFGHKKVLMKLEMQAAWLASSLILFSAYSHGKVPIYRLMTTLLLLWWTQRDEIKLFKKCPDLPPMRLMGHYSNFSNKFPDTAGQLEDSMWQNANWKGGGQLLQTWTGVCASDCVLWWKILYFGI